MLKMATPLAGGIVGGEVDGVRSCTFDECYASPCDAHIAPYTCLLHNGGPHGGCSSDEWTKETCDDQCNLSACGSIPIPTDMDSCENNSAILLGVRVDKFVGMMFLTSVWWDLLDLAVAMMRCIGRCWW